MENFTEKIHKVREANSVYNTIYYAYRWQMSYPQYPIRPVLASPRPTQAEVKSYQDALAKFDAELAKYNEEKEIVEGQNASLFDAIAEFIKQEAGLYAIPKVAQDKVWYKAWEDGHSSGYTEVYGHLESLVSLFDGINCE